MDEIAAADNAGEVDSRGRKTTAVPSGRSRGAGRSPRRPRAAAPRRETAEPEPYVLPSWFGPRNAGLVCCLEIREAVSVHIRLDEGHERGERDRTVSAYQPFALTTASGVCTLDPRVRDDVDRADLAPLLRLTRRRAYEPEWSEDGQAVIGFEDGSLLTYPAHPTETSWMLTGQYGQTWSSRPGGRIVANEDPPTTSMM